MEQMTFCQSCGMPMNEEVKGTESGGALSEDYCKYCYQDGQFTNNMTMDEMIEFCVPIMAQNNENMTEQQARDSMREFFPKLKRWMQ